MAGSNINRVILTGNLTRDPESRMAGNTMVCNLGIAVNGRRKQGDSWVDVPNFFNISVFGAQGENCQKFLSKGRPIAVDGRLQYRQWEDKDGNKRSAVDIIADTVQFLGGRDDASSGNGNGFSASVRAVESDIPVDTADFVSASVGSGSAADDDIPF